MSMPPPYGVILDSLMNGSVVPVLGAGASLIGRRPDEIWNANSDFFPAGGELSRFLANKCEYHSADSRKMEELTKVSSYYQDIGGRPLLRRTLRGVFKKGCKPNCLHQFLLDLERNMEHQLVIVVTNYDTLLEDAFETARRNAESEELRKRPFDLVVYPADDPSNGAMTLSWRWNGTSLEKQKPEYPNVFLIDDTPTVIFKMHGTIWKETDKWDNFVITEEDYLEFMSRMITEKAVPSSIASHFLDKSFLFLGYSLQDWNMRVILRHLRGRAPAPSWAIQLNVEDDDERLWKTRNVNLYQADLRVFAEKMTEKLTERLAEKKHDRMES